jgi:hypothetical protein
VNGIAGLRNVAGTVEFLDAAGAPRLRMTAPWGADASAKRFTPVVSIAGCAYDTNPAAPWDRPVTAPGADHCDITVRWPATGLEYPLVVDPSWTTTANMAQARSRFAAGVFANGKVIVAGGETAFYTEPARDTAIASVELFDATSGTWADGMPLTTARAYAMGTITANDEFLITAGSNVADFGYDTDRGTDTAKATFEVYASTGIRARTANLRRARIRHRVARIGNDVLIAGGGTYATAYSGADTEILAQAALTTMAGPAIAYPVANFVLAPLPGGRLLVAGGGAGAVCPSSTYEPGTGFVTRQNLSDVMPFANCSVEGISWAALSDGRVIITGGGNQAAVAPARYAAIFDPVTNLWSTAAAPPVRYYAEGGSGMLIPTLAGGALSPHVAAAISWNSVTNLWTAGPVLTRDHHSGASLRLSDKRWLVVGGDSANFAAGGFPAANNPANNVSEILGCATSAECATGTEYFRSAQQPVCNRNSGPDVGRCDACNSHAILPNAKPLECDSAKPVCGGTGECVVKLANSVLLAQPAPVAPFADGKCTPAAGIALCASRVCSPKDDKCGIPDGDPAINADAIATNDIAVCRTPNIRPDGKCGPTLAPPTPTPTVPPAPTKPPTVYAVEGGGCDCQVVGSSSTSPVGRLAAGGMAISALLLAIRRKRAPS